MKVAFIYDNLSYRGGSIKQIIELANYFTSHGIEVTVFTTTYSAENCFPEIKKNFKIKNLNIATPKNLFLMPFVNRVTKIKQMKKILSQEKGKIDIFIVHDAPYYMLFKYIRQKYKESSLIWHINDLPIPFDILLKKSFDSPIHLKVLTSILRKIDKYYIGYIETVTTLSNRNRDNIKKLFNLNSIVVNTGTDVFFSQKRKIKDLSKKNEITILSVGAFYRNRRYEDIVEAISLLSKSNKAKKYYLKVVGFPGSDYPYYLFVKELVNKLKLEEQVKFIEKIDNDDLKKEYHNADIYVQSTDHIGWTIPATEAMLSELPVIITDNCGLNEVLTDKKEALIVKPKRPELIAKDIAKIVKDKRLYDDLCKNGKRFVLDNLTWEQYCKNYLNLVKSIIAEPKDR